MAVDKLVDSTQLDADLTSVANAIRTKGGTSAQLAFPAGFVSAVQAIPTGGGGNLGGLANMVDVNDPEYPFGFMLSAMKNGQTKGGTITAASTYPNSETLFLSTGLSVIHGLMLAGPSLDNATSLGSGESGKFCIFFCYNFQNYPTPSWNGYAITQANAQKYGYGTIGTASTAVHNGTLRFDGGDIYYTARYNKNNNYQIIRSNMQYDWLAW